MEVLAWILFLLTLAWAVFVTWQVVKLARVVFLVEDTVSEATDALKALQETLLRYRNMRLFSDSPDLKNLLDHALIDVRVASATIQKIMDKLTQFSRQKYVIDREPTEEDLMNEIDERRKLASLIQKHPDLMEPVAPEEEFDNTRNLP